MKCDKFSMTIAQEFYLGKHVVSQVQECAGICLPPSMKAMQWRKTDKMLLNSNHTNFKVWKILRRGQFFCGWSQDHLPAEKLYSNSGKK